jgi:glycosyltransferase involved in cell wall biosynthesis/CDP-glycerol glycerophosphotransferase (TagB/SpsB family)
VLTVVIPVYNVAPYLAECLDSVLGQSLTDLEVIAVDDGSTDNCLEILRSYAERDARLRVLTQKNAGQGAARNLGVAEARGEFLTFCDSDDTVPRRAYKAMVRTLRRSGSDLVVGAAQRTRHGVARQVAWGRTVHEVDRIATTIDDFPAAMQDIIACNRVFRTAFWRDRIGGFGARTAYEDHVPMLAAYVRAERFDVLARVTYLWRAREDLTSTGQQKAVTQNLLDRITVKEEAYDLLRAEASEATYDAWVGRCLDIDFPPFLPHALTGSDEYREALATTYRTFLDRATPRALRTVRHDRAVRAWLCAERQWEALTLADEHFRTAGPPPVRVVGDRLFAVPDLPTSVGELVPAELWSLADSETALRTGLRWVAVDGSALRISGWALVPGLGTAERGGELEAWLVEGGAGTVVPLSVTVLADPEVDQWANDGNVSYLHSAFDAAVDLGVLTEAGSPSTWTLRLRLSHGPVVRESGVYDAIDGSPAQLLRAAVGDARGTPVRVKPGWDPASGFRVLVGPAADSDDDADHGPGIRVSRLDLEPGALLVEATTKGLAEGEIAAARWRGRYLDLPVTTVEPVGESVRLRFATTTTAPYGVETLAPNGRYTLVVATQDGGEVEATASVSLARALPSSGAGGHHRLTRRLRSDGTLVALLGAPLDDEERRPDVQHRWRRTHQQRQTTPGSSPAVLLHVAGGSVSDSPAALDAALARLRPDVTRHWAVRDRSVVVPDGASAVLVGSREWYDVLASAPMLWTSGELPAYFVRHPDQRTLQTFAGFPTEPIGVSAWRARGQTARGVALELARRHQQWQSLVAPSEAAAELYRREFEFDGAVLVTGYPRYDSLVNRDRETVRAAVLARMGVPLDHRVVLYAPAPRDRTHPLLRSAAPAELDVRRMAAALGDGHLVLTLGMRRLEETDPGAAPVVDVTHGPAPNDVLLTADAAVLDYSDLRLDWALTRRPAIFHVPDHDARLAALSSVVDFDSTAAGPRVADLDGVLDHLRDLDGLRDQHATAVAELNRTHHALHDGHAGERVIQALLG